LHPSSRIGTVVIKISKASSLWVFAETLLENCTHLIIYVRAEIQCVERLIVEIDVCHKPLIKAREFLLLLLRQYDEAICGVPQSIWRWRG
jgi:hypothetical protein